MARGRQRLAVAMPSVATGARHRGGHAGAVRRAAAVLVAIALVAHGADARADNGLGDIVRGFIAALFITEALVPDVRLVFGPDDHRWELAWPIVVATLPAVRGDSVGLSLHPFVEPQYQKTRDALRLAGGLRAILYSRKEDFQLAPLVEAGALGGSDGSGWFAGAGLAVGDPELGVTFALVGRAVDTDQERRYSIGFDLQLPLTSPEY